MEVSGQCRPPAASPQGKRKLLRSLQAKPSQGLSWAVEPRKEEEEEKKSPRYPLD